MNKLLLWIKNVLMFVLAILIVKTYVTLNQNYLLYFTLFIIYVYISLMDLYKNKNINKNTLYNILSILVLLISIFIFVRVLYDDGFIYNSNYYLNKLIEVTGNSLDTVKMETKMYLIYYLRQNVFFLSVLMSLLFIYRQLNITKTKKEHFINTIIIFITSILSLLPIIEIIKKWDREFYIIYIIGILILLGIVLVRKKQNKYFEHGIIFYITVLLFILDILVSTIGKLIIAFF